MIGLKQISQRKGAIRWPEIMAGIYLLLFLITVCFLPLSGFLQPPNAINLDQVYQPPFAFTLASKMHYLGTDQVGRDVFSNLVFGARTAVLVSLPAMVLATVIGLGMGSLAGYWGDTGLRGSISSFLIFLIMVLWGIYYCFYVRQTYWQLAFTSGTKGILWEVAITCFVFFILIFVGKTFSGLLQRFKATKQIAFPIDQVVLKLIEIVGTVPRLLLVMLLTAFVQPAVINIIILASFTYWTGIARLIRGELLQIKELPYIEAARVAGLKDWTILVRHALPNALPPVIVAFAFGLGNLMSLESTLAFLKIGIPPDEPSWGRLMQNFRENGSAWWLFVFPAFTLCCTVLSIQVVARYFLRRVNPKNK